MIATSDLLTIANDRLADAEALLNAERFDGAAYLCGYCIEIALKHKICLTLNWTHFPATNNEFKGYTSLKTHDLDILLAFTGIESVIKTTHLAEWSFVSDWNPEARYNPTGNVSEMDATLMIQSAQTLLPLL